MFGLVSRKRLDGALATVEIALDRLIELKKDYDGEKAEVRRLTNVIIQMRRQEDFNLRPEHTDERWKGGSYIMEEEEGGKSGHDPHKPFPDIDEEDLALAADVEAQMAADFDRLFEED